MASIPTWGWILFLLVAFDDIIMWMKSPYLAIPLILILVLIVGILMVGGKGAMGNIGNTVKNTLSSAVTGATTKVASSMLKRD